MNHYQDALDELSELTVATKRLAIEAINDSTDSDTAQMLVAIRSMCSLMGVILSRYGADTETMDEHMLAPLHRENLEKFEREAKQ